MSTFTIAQLYSFMTQEIEAGKGDEPVMYQYIGREHVESMAGGSVSPGLWSIFAHGMQDQFADEVSLLAKSYWMRWDVTEGAAAELQAKEEAEAG